MRFIKKFCSYYKPYVGTFIADMLCAILLSACNMVYPLVTRKMLNDYIPNSDLRALFVSSGLLLLLFILKYLFNYYITYYGHVMGINMQADMRNEVFEHLQRLPLTYFDNNKTGAVMSRIVNDLQDFSELAHHGPENLILSVIMLVGAFSIMASICLPLTLIIYAAVPFLAVFTMRNRKARNAARLESKEKIGAVNATLENSISGIRVSKAYTNKDREFALFNKGNEEFKKARKKTFRAIADFHVGSALSIDIVRLIMYAAGGVFVCRGDINIADFTAFLLYISYVISPVERLVDFTEQYEEGMAGFTRFLEVMDYPAERDTEGAVELTDPSGKIEFRGVSFSYNEKRNVLTDLSFTTEAGRKLALVGSSGGGKTTICNLIPRFYDISAGEILIDGTDIRHFTLESLRKSIGIVSQDVFLFDSTVYENILYGRCDATREEVMEAAKLANIHDFIMSLPDGYETQVGERGVKLSGGQKQRVSIARIFLKDPAILILDEATSALDNATELAIKESLDELCRGRTSIIVAHRLTTVRSADEILVVTKDGIAERGSHDELMALGGEYATLWHSSSYDGLN